MNVVNRTSSQDKDGKENISDSNDRDLRDKFSHVSSDPAHFSSCSSWGLRAVGYFQKHRLIYSKLSTTVHQGQVAQRLTSNRILVSMKFTRRSTDGSNLELSKFSPSRHLTGSTALSPRPLFHAPEAGPCRRVIDRVGRLVYRGAIL